MARLGLIGVAAAPTRHAAKSDTTKLAVLGNMIATTSPAETPWACSTAAARTTASRNSALVWLMLSSAMLGPDGSCLARRSGKVARFMCGPKIVEYLTWPGY
jgi:hypothetical protein